ncbi:hypothetical protein B0T26DRAFT_677187 [Lasiosphaeria miniovina]|uniref:Uncharacterized protein n=1 Tax=Lasiosphaeria miniovina TaxID=1954250 RepID=A0AA40ABG6_9PEZI|nr:uncharacterized protein B0T26DRAFT_677187 [Lasiosphaeria miniovina]KAK0712766.1 hypothetical protein B0T26DRAFT_677187 [Lasiosphaeria miniovina]
MWRLLCFATCFMLAGLHARQSPCSPVSISVDLGTAEDTHPPPLAPPSPYESKTFYSGVEGRLLARTSTYAYPQSRIEDGIDYKAFATIGKDRKILSACICWEHARDAALVCCFILRKAGVLDMEVEVREVDPAFSAYDGGLGYIINPAHGRGPAHWRGCQASFVTDPTTATASAFAWVAAGKTAASTRWLRSSCSTTTCRRTTTPEAPNRQHTCMHIRNVPARKMLKRIAAYINSSTRLRDDYPAA